MSEVLNLSKGDVINLTKQGDSVLHRINIGLGWDASNGSPIDLDASAIIYNTGGTKIGHSFFNEKDYANGAVVLSGDNRTGEGDGDDETLYFDFSKWPAEADKAMITITNYTGQALSVLQNAFARAYDAESGKELARFELNAFGDHTALYMALVRRTAEGFTLQALGMPGDGKTFSDLLPGAAQYL